MYIVYRCVCVCVCVYIYMYTYILLMRLLTYTSTAPPRRCVFEFSFTNPYMPSVPPAHAPVRTCRNIILIQIRGAHAQPLDVGCRQIGGIVCLQRVVSMGILHMHVYVCMCICVCAYDGLPINGYGLRLAVPTSFSTPLSHQHPHVSAWG